MELWSLMHFLMPHIFRSRKVDREVCYLHLCQEFSYWFNNPLNSMVEGNRGINNDIISRLHGIMRPFLLRRLKKDVAKQLPPKYEHVIMCKLSKRQALLYEEFMSRTSTRALMSGGNYLGMMNILMQLRKVL
jgi:SNF2 family DNA or RNA helicase